MAAANENLTDAVMQSSNHATSKTKSTIKVLTVILPHLQFVSKRKEMRCEDTKGDTIHNQLMKNDYYTFILSYDQN